MAMPLTLLQRPHLALEIGVVLAIKILLLWLIWSIWFSRPAAPHMQLPPNEVARQLLAAPAAIESISRTTPGSSARPASNGGEE